ncbi:MAG: hypothetical protein KGL39_57675 [Patescibacteria group bacterium]|nr:hypothetical protein [Patescibacteria group bacterium]
MINEINGKYSLGKGEVESSILSRSTSQAIDFSMENPVCEKLSHTEIGNYRRTSAEHGRWTRAKSVRFVRRLFRHPA